MSACVLSDICSSQRNGARISSTRPRTAACSSQPLLTARSPAGGAENDEAERDRRREEHDGDRAGVAEVREVEGLQVGVVVRHLGHRARPAVGTARVSPVSPTYLAMRAMLNLLTA